MNNERRTPLSMSSATIQDRHIQRTKVALLACLAAVAVACGGGGEEAVVRDTLAASTEPMPLAQAQAATAAPILWNNSPVGVAIAVDGANSAYTVTSRSPTASVISVTRRAAAGNVLWTRSDSDLRAGQVAAASAVIIDATGSILATGTLRSNASVDVGGLLLKFAPDGTLVRRIELADAGLLAANAMVTDAAGNAYILSMGTPSRNIAPTATMTKVAPDGAVRWTWFSNADIGTASKLVWSGDGRLLAIAPGDFGSGFAVVDPAFGTTVLTQQFNWMSDAAGDASGNVYVLLPNRICRCTTLRSYDSDGNVVREGVYGSTHVVRQLQFDRDGRLVLSGSAAGPWYVEKRTEMAILWSRNDLFLDGAPTSMLVLDADGNVLIGPRTDFTSIRVIKLDSSTGDELSSTPVALDTSAGTVSIVLGNDRSAFITADGSITARLANDAQPQGADLRVVSLTDSSDPVRRNGWVRYTAVVGPKLL